MSFYFFDMCRFYDAKSVYYWVYVLRITVERMEMHKFLLAGGNINYMADMSCDSISHDNGFRFRFRNAIASATDAAIRTDSSVSKRHAVTGATM